jgi:hypothetical protein
MFIVFTVAELPAYGGIPSAVLQLGRNESTADADRKSVV